MARARNLKPGFFTNGDLLECQPLARLLFAGLWTEADCRGILEDRPKTIKIKILPGDNCDIDALLAELEAHGFVLRYAVGGVKCILVRNFEKHQNPHVNEKPSTLPAPDYDDEVPARAPEQHQSGTMQAPEQYGASTVQAPEQHQSAPAESIYTTDSPLLNPSEEPKPTRKRADKVLAMPFAYVEALCDATGTDVSEISDAVKSKQGAVAKRLRASGMTPDEVRTCAGWLKSQTWRTHGIDLFTVEKERGAWEIAGKPERATKGETQSTDGSAYFDGTQWRRADGLAY